MLPVRNQDNFGARLGDFAALTGSSAVWFIYQQTDSFLPLTAVAAFNMGLAIMNGREVGMLWAQRGNNDNRNYAISRGIIGLTQLYIAGKAVPILFNKIFSDQSSAKKGD